MGTADEIVRFGTVYRICQAPAEIIAGRVNARTSMDPAYLAIMLLVLGLALIIVEFFVPSSGMITIMAIVSLISAVWFAWKAWGTSSPSLFWSFVTVLLVALPATLGGTLYAIQNTRLGAHVMLEAPSLEEVTPYAREQRRLQQYVGKTGRTLTMLNPGGLVLVEGERVHSETPGILIDRDETVEIIAVKGTRIVVQPAAPGREVETKPEPHDLQAREASLDFDLPPT